MAQYLVTMDIDRVDPFLPIDQLARVLRKTILPSVESLARLQAQGRVVTGGYPVGERFMVFVVEADSEEDLQEILDELPLSGVTNVKATRLRGFEELRDERGGS